MSNQYDEPRRFEYNEPRNADAEHRNFDHDESRNFDAEDFNEPQEQRPVPNATPATNSGVAFFLRSNVRKRRDRIEYKVSDRFSEPIIVRPLTAKELMRLQGEFTSVTSGGKAEFDNEGYTIAAVIASIVFPDLANAELQDSWGASNPAELVQEMFDGGEFMRLNEFILRINGLTKTTGNLKEQAKN